MEDANHQPDNPYTAIEGFDVYDVRGERAGEVKATVYDAPSDVLKYLIVEGRAVPADRMEVDAERGRVLVPYEAKAIASAPEMQETSGKFDETVHEHFGST